MPSPVSLTRSVTYQPAGISGSCPAGSPRPVARTPSQSAAYLRLVETLFTFAQSCLGPLAPGDVTQQHHHATAVTGPVLHAHFHVKYTALLAALAGFEAILTQSRQLRYARGGVRGGFNGLQLRNAHGQQLLRDRLKQGIDRFQRVAPVRLRLYQRLSLSAGEARRRPEDVLAEPTELQNRYKATEWMSEARRAPAPCCPNPYGACTANQRSL